MGDNKKSFQSPEVWKFKTAKKFRKCEIFMLCIFIDEKNHKYLRAMNTGIP